MYNSQLAIILFNVLIEAATFDDAREILQLQRLSYQSEAVIYNGYAIEMDVIFIGEGILATILHSAFGPYAVHGFLE